MFSWFKDDSTAADIYIDLGTANTVISARGKGVVVNEPSIVAQVVTSNQKRKIIAVGKEAKEIADKQTGNIVIQKPIKDGVIADFDSAEYLLKYFLNHPRVKVHYSSPRVVISLPFGVTEVEKKAVVTACKKAGAKKVYLIDEPMAAAIGAGLKIKSPVGSMIVDIGGGTTEVAVIALADIVYCEAIRVGGHKIDADIVQYFRRYKNIVIPETQAEFLKISIGTAVPKKDIQTAMITGRDVDSGLPTSMEITSEQVGLAMNDSLQEIINAIHKALENTPPELVSDIIDQGIWLAGGGALIRDFSLRIQNEVRLPVNIADSPLVAIAKGGERVLNDPTLLEKIQLEI
ncbi:MAG: rod shape-determining protein [Bdellovibrionaceae bacterium]|mgnify:FL=1|nr:rod shape-determining protein [Pseudobdellovibrionaceae bacterium]